MRGRASKKGGRGGSSTVFMNELDGGQSLASPGWLRRKGNNSIYSWSADAEFHCPRGDHFGNKKKRNQIKYEERKTKCKYIHTYSTNIYKYICIFISCQVQVPGSSCAPFSCSSPLPANASHGCDFNFIHK